VFKIDQVYARRDIHARYGGQPQGGISTPRRHPVVFLFTGEAGEAHGYEDGWFGDGVFQYSGQGQVGNMKFDRGNLAIRDHALTGKDLHLFEMIGKGQVRYLGQMEYVRHELKEEVPDRTDKLRQAILFRLKRVT